MRLLLRQSRLVAALMALLLVLAACATDDGADGDDGDSDGDTEDTSDEGDSGASDAAELYDGETITIVSPFPAGGTADLLARAVAEGLPQFLDADVSTEVENVTGGGGAAGMLDVVERREGDGNAIVISTMGMMFRWLLGEEGHDYPLPELPVIGAMSAPLVTVGREESTPDLQSVLDGEGLQWAANAPSASGGIKGALAVELLNPDGIEMVYGFDAEAEQAVSMERGEIDLASPSFAAYFASFEPIDGVVPIFQSGVLTPDGEVERVSDLPDVPHLAEVYEDETGEELSGDAVTAYEVLVAAFTTGQTAFMHPDTPQENVDVLVEAFGEMYESDEWAQISEDLLGVFQPGDSGEVAGPVLEEFLAADEETIQILQDVQE